MTLCKMKLERRFSSVSLNIYTDYFRIVQCKEREKAAQPSHWNPYFYCWNVLLQNPIPGMHMLIYRRRKVSAPLEAVMHETYVMQQNHLLLRAKEVMLLFLFRILILLFLAHFTGGRLACTRRDWRHSMNLDRAI